MIEHDILSHRLANQFARMRVESNDAPGTFQQLRIALLRGHTWKLASLYRRIKVLKSELEVCYTTPRWPHSR